VYLKTRHKLQPSLPEPRTRAIDTAVFFVIVGAFDTESCYILQEDLGLLILWPHLPNPVLIFQMVFHSPSRQITLSKKLKENLTLLLQMTLEFFIGNLLFGKIIHQAVYGSTPRGGK
jgi:hypothetical protein